MTSYYSSLYRKFLCTSPYLKYFYGESSHMVFQFQFQLRLQGVLDGFFLVSCLRIYLGTFCKSFLMNHERSIVRTTMMLLTKTKDEPRQIIHWDAFVALVIFIVAMLDRTWTERDNRDRPRTTRPRSCKSASDQVLNVIRMFQTVLWAGYKIDALAYVRIYLCDCRPAPMNVVLHIFTRAILFRLSRKKTAQPTHERE